MQKLNSLRIVEEIERATIAEQRKGVNADTAKDEARMSVEETGRQQENRRYKETEGDELSYQKQHAMLRHG